MTVKSLHLELVVMWVFKRFVGRQMLCLSSKLTSQMLSQMTHQIRQMASLNSKTEELQYIDGIRNKESILTLKNSYPDIRQYVNIKVPENVRMGFCLSEPRVTHFDLPIC
jgi:hypothetical protein